ncbi:two-component regulator propeller domain-containing protein [Rhodothermus marinus]|uniref:two-component regulator propeller domain-containing protein n=1 Tax=Rhodothermus marinus TaxID=29549 RepID=UPI0006CFC327|nr:two-component regulator propeller domain-containing protein [Rhodothermus marinus]
MPVWPLAVDRQPGENPFLLSGLSVNDLAVDPANRLWVATDDGVYVVEQAGVDFRIAEHFTQENSPLLSDVVQAVAVDARSGRVFLATAPGLSATRATPSRRRNRYGRCLFTRTRCASGRRKTRRCSLKAWSKRPSYGS